MAHLFNQKRYSFLLFIIFIVFQTSVFASNQENFDVLYYEINLSVNPDAETVAGFVLIKSVSLTDELNQLDLDLYDNMTVTSVSENAVSFSHTDDILQINLDKNYQQNDTITVKIEYNGSPSSGISFDPMTFDRSRSTVTISSESCPYYARCWWPCKDRPDDKPVSMDVKITVPSNLVVASNGALVEVINNGNSTKTHHWQIRNPIPTYLVSFTITDYQIIDDEYISTQNDTLPIMIFAFPEDYQKALVDFDNVKDMIEILSSYYGEYPYLNEKYGIAEYVGYWGGMEYQTLSCLQPYLIQGNHYYDDVFVHELAHQWWGDCVTPKDFHHSWVSEGFATFTEALYFGHLEGEEKYFDYMHQQNNALTYKGTIYRYDISDPDIVYDGIVYYKGAWVLHMLRNVVGEENFWGGLHEYMSRYKYSSATTEDLQQVFEEVSGNPLEYFFHQWIYESGHPYYYYGWQQEDLGNGQYKLKAFIDQIQKDAPLFEMPVDFTITTTAGETTLVKTISDSTERFEFIANDPITNFQFDKDGWILKETKFVATPILKYYEHEIMDSTGNNNGLADPGEEVRLAVNILNNGTDAYSISAKITSDDPFIQIPDETAFASFSGIGYSHLDHSLAMNFNFSVNSDASGHLATFYIHIDSDNDYMAVDSFNVKIGDPVILLVDDDNGADYENYFSQPMMLSKVYSDTWDVSTQGVPDYESVLQKYQSVIWFTGDDNKTSLTTGEQSALAKYLDNGGDLLLTGQNIGEDLIGEGSKEDSLFYSNYLHAEFVADTVKSTMLVGISADPIGNGLFVYILESAGGAGNQQSPSEIAPINGAASILKYLPQGSSAGIRYHNESNGSHLVYLAFGFEGISGPYKDSAQKLMTRILDWYSMPTKIAVQQTNNPIENYRLEQNYPNPFNPITQIKFQIPRSEHVELNIFNMTGQKIKTLINHELPQGSHEIIWDGTNHSGMKVSSGLYIYQIKTKSYSCSKKLAMVK